jgi:hypothetical protein
MAIKWHTLVTETAENGTQRQERVEGKYINKGTDQEKWVLETHVGLVATTTYTRSERVMSDVYANVSYCKVYNPDKDRLEEIAIGYHFECGTEFGTAVVDLDPKITDRLNERKRKAEAAAIAETKRQRKIQAEEEALRALLTPRKDYVGLTFRAIKGRKVPKGTTGRLIRVSSDGLRSQVRFATKAGGTAEEWTDSSNLEVYPPGIDPQNPPTADENSNWVLVSYIMLAKKREWAQKWGKSSPHRVRPPGDLKYNSGRKRGRVFWEADGRVGIKNVKSREGKATWGTPSEIEYEINGKWVRGEDYFLTVPQLVQDPNLGEPFNGIVALVGQQDGTWEAVREDGSPVMLFPQEALGTTFKRR